MPPKLDDDADSARREAWSNQLDTKLPAASHGFEKKKKHKAPPSVDEPIRKWNGPLE